MIKLNHGKYGLLLLVSSLLTLIIYFFLTLHLFQQGRECAWGNIPCLALSNPLPFSSLTTNDYIFIIQKTFSYSVYHILFGPLVIDYFDQFVDPGYFNYPSLILLIFWIYLLAGRLKDAGKSSWWALTGLIPFLGIIPFVSLLFVKSKPFK